MTGSTSQDNSYLWVLLERAKQGEALAFHEFFNELYTPVYRYLLVRLKHKETAEDCAQITFSKVFLHLHTIEKRAETPLQYLFTVARNTLIDETRKKRPDNASDEAWSTFFANENTEEIASQSYVFSEILTSIESFEDEHKDILTWRLLDHLSHQEIAEILGKSDASVRKIYSRALEKLREMLTNKGITYETGI
jgi:RNA polymerase sigma factor (sigma-70 family)